MTKIGDRNLSADELIEVADEMAHEAEESPEDMGVENSQEGEAPSDFEKKSAEAAVKIYAKARDIVWLSDVGKDDVNLVGGKGANLAEMYNLKLPVPPAFVVTAKAYKNFIESKGIKDKIRKVLLGLDFEDTKQLEFRTGLIQEMIMDEKMPDSLISEIKSAYEGMDIDQEVARNASANVLNILKTSRESSFVAVRSSATAEDLEGASFAGQQETFLNIKGWRDLVEHVKKCWASLFTARATYYRNKKGFPQEDTYIAVIVQKMINSDKAGVIFTVNPATNNLKEIVVEAAFGLGEGVVSGAVAPDYYVVDKETLKPLIKRIAHKKVYFTKSSAGETVKKELDEEKSHEQVLELRDLVRLTSYAKQIEEHYSIPQDIEWGMEFGKIFILQTRPVTTYQNPVSLEEVQGEVILEGLPACPGVVSGKVKVIKEMSDLDRIKKGDILVTQMTNPDMVVTMQKSAAIITDEGGMTAHAAIVSREIGIPCIVGTGKATSVLKEGDIITIDGKSGKVYKGDVSMRETIKPEEKEAKELEIPINMTEEFTHEQLHRPVQAIEAEEGKKIKTKIYMNLSQPGKIDECKSLDFDGVGLMRIEFVIASQIGKHPQFMIANGKEQEYVDKLESAISKVAQAISPKPVIVRFSDFKSNEYRGLEGGSKYEAEESNPMMGFRGVSRYISEQFEQAFRLECRAVRSAREKSGNIWVMLPFVRIEEEVNKCLNIMESEGLRRDGNFKIFLMAEVPSMALMPEEFARLQIDGASIGSNDLTQLIMGVSRDSAVLNKKGYFDERKKPVLLAVHNIIKGFHKFGKTVSICGEAPSSYPEFAEFLIKQGIDSISVNPDKVNETRKLVEKIETGTLSI